MDRNGKANVMWDFDFQFKVLEHRKPVIVTFRRDRQKSDVSDN